MRFSVSRPVVIKVDTLHFGNENFETSTLSSTAVPEVDTNVLTEERTRNIESFLMQNEDDCNFRLRNELSIEKEKNSCLEDIEKERKTGHWTETSNSVTSLEIQKMQRGKSEIIDFIYSFIFQLSLNSMKLLASEASGKFYSVILSLMLRGNKVDKHQMFEEFGLMVCPPYSECHCNTFQKLGLGCFDV